MAKNFLCADIGGTNSRFAHFCFDNKDLKLIKYHICPTSILLTTDDALQNAALCGLKPEDADQNIWGIAGPIDADALGAKLTNHILRLDFRTYIKNKHLRHMHLTNDFSLQAWGTIASNLQHRVIIDKTPQSQSTRSIIGCGTGLGTAALVATPTYYALQAEGGHTDMAFRGTDELDFANFACNYLKQKNLNAEDILSARGLSLLHAYFYNENLTAKEAVNAFWDVQGNETLQLKLYARFLGRFCKNWALSTLCFGGLYLSGGVLIKNPKILQSSSFTQEFYNTNMLDILQKIPVFLVAHEDIALWGAATYTQYMEKNNFNS